LEETADLCGVTMSKKKHEIPEELLAE